MARNLEDIQAAILAKKTQTESLNALAVLTTSEKNTLNNLTSTSKAAIWRLWVFIVAYAIWLHENIFDTHKAEIEELIASQKIHTARWYRGEALKFQLGDELTEDGLYENENVEEADLISSRIIAQASVEEVAGRLKIKAAKLESEDLAPLSASELFAFTQYMELIKDAGTRLLVVSGIPDDLRLTLDIYFDPLVLDANGARLDGTNNEPVIEAVEKFLHNLEFNGEFILTKLVDYLQLVNGVQFPVVKLASARFGANNYATVNETYLAESGYMKLNQDVTIINYIAREVL